VAEVPLFAGGGLAAHPLRRDQIPALQAFYDGNPEYFLTVNGRPPPADLAAQEFDEVPPPHLTFERQWCLGLFAAEEEGGALQGIAMVTEGLCQPGVWHLGLFIVATHLQGRGVAAGSYAALEGWVRRSGARHLRLGVVQGNRRAARFWLRQGFVPLRTREGVDTGGRVNTVQVMLKPLADEGIPAYLQAVPRDQPGSPLP